MLRNLMLKLIKKTKTSSINPSLPPNPSSTKNPQHLTSPSPKHSQLPSHCNLYINHLNLQFTLITTITQTFSFNQTLFKLIKQFRQIKHRMKSRSDIIQHNQLFK